MVFHVNTEGKEITVNSLKTYRRLFVSLECHMQLKYGGWTKTENHRWNSEESL